MIINLQNRNITGRFKNLMNQIQLAEGPPYKLGQKQKSMYNFKHKDGWHIPGVIDSNPNLDNMKGNYKDKNKWKNTHK